MKQIKHIQGDVLRPIGEGKKIIPHCCNDLGIMGAGVALAIKRKWPIVFNKYKSWSQQKSFKLGKVQFIKVEEDIIIANMIGQHDVRTKNRVAPIRYGAINKCLASIAETALKCNASVHAPRFGAGLAGGKWDLIEKSIIQNLCEKDIEVVIYLI